MMSAYSVVKTGKNEVTSRSLGCRADTIAGERTTGLPPDTYEAVKRNHFCEDTYIGHHSIIPN